MSDLISHLPDIRLEKLLLYPNPELQLVEVHVLENRNKNQFDIEVYLGRNRMTRFSVYGVFKGPFNTSLSRIRRSSTSIMGVESLGSVQAARNARQ